MRSSALPRVGVPFLDLHAQYEGLRSEILAAITRVCESQHFILGPEVEAFEAEIAEYLSVRDAIGVSSGTDALLASLMALGIGEGDEVITTDYSFFATAGSICRVGARPVLVDIDPLTFNVLPSALAAAITAHTKAIRVFPAPFGPDVQARQLYTEDCRLQRVQSEVAANHLVHVSVALPVTRTSRSRRSDSSRLPG